MDQLSLPLKIDLINGPDNFSGTVIIEPLYPGYGTTLGNALRRVLLSSLPGAAVTAIKIQNAPHEFTTLPKVQEDILQIMLNLKQLRARVYCEEPVKLHLSVKGECRVTAGDFEPNSQVKIVNPDLLIATLTARHAELDMEIWLSQGRGYVPTESREKEKMEIGTIAVDALYSPIRQVAFKVEPARVGQMTNYDKLLLDIKTDGTITVAEAVSFSCKVLIDHFTLFSEQFNKLVDEQNIEQLKSEQTKADNEERPKKKRGRKPKGE